MIKLEISAFIILFSIEIQADIAPDPIKAKGISINVPTEIKMTYEKVVVDLTPDSSFVHCYFRLHNEGKAHKIQIGYPNMSYYSNNYQRRFRFNPINVYENGQKIDNIDFYAPDSINLRNNDNRNKPWYLWDTCFDDNETKVIVVSYSLPHGKVKNDLYCTFDYLLSTGAGWKGNIDTAEIVVNWRNYDRYLIFDISPESYSNSGNQFIWKFFNLEPSLADNISIKYEREKGQYERRKGQYEKWLKSIRDREPVMILNDTITMSSIDISDYNGPENVSLDNLATILVIKDSVTIKKKFPGVDGSNGIILIYTKNYVIDKLSGILLSKMTKNHNAFKINSISDFEEKYSLIVNQRNIEKGNARYDEIINIDNDRIVKASIVHQKKTDYKITIKTE